MGFAQRSVGLGQRVAGDCEQVGRESLGEERLEGVGDGDGKRVVVEVNEDRSAQACSEPTRLAPRGRIAAGP